MLKLGTIVLLTVGIISLNVQLIVENKSFLLAERLSTDGWSRSCTYYKPFEVVRVTRPAHFGCSRFASIS